MARIVITETASIDQAAILEDLVEKAGLRVAAKFRALFRTFFDRLTYHPASGPRRPMHGPNVRIGVVTPYIVIYRYIEGDDIVTIMRLIHAHRAVDRRQGLTRNAAYCAKNISVST